MDAEIEGRLATLEANYTNLAEDLHTVAKDVTAIKNTVVKSKGFVAGAAAVIVPLWTVVAAVAVYVWRHMSGGQ